MREKELTTVYLALKNKVDQLEKELKQSKSIIDKIKLPTQQLIIKDSFTKFDCAECGQPFLLSEGQMRRRHDKGRSFTCSAGHENVFTLKQQLP